MNVQSIHTYPKMSDESDLLSQLTVCALGSCCLCHLDDSLLTISSWVSNTLPLNPNYLNYYASFCLEIKTKLR